MTSIAATLSVDARGPSAIYIVADSRYTWGSAHKRWDSGQKVFASTRTPDIFGFCGDAFFPPAIFQQALELANCGLILGGAASAAERHASMLEVFKNAISSQQLTPLQPFSLFHAARDGEGMKSTFRLWESRNTQDGKWYDQEHNLNADKSYLIHVDGSGGGHVSKRGAEWVKTDAEGTSRAAIWSFCDALEKGDDPLSGGAPQLCGIWRIGNGRYFGMIWKDKKYLAGMEVPSTADFTSVHWFNAMFERCDGETGERLEDAQAHARPQGSS